MSVWICRAGRHGEYEPSFLEDSKIYFTYEEVATSLVSIGTKHALKDHFMSVSPTVKEKTAQAWAAQGYAFAYTMKRGERVILPSKVFPGMVYVGEISGDYVFNEAAQDSYRHSRSVKWSVRIPRAYFAPDLQSGFGVPLTIYKFRDEERLNKAISLYSEASTPPRKYVLTGLGGELSRCDQRTYHNELQGAWSF